MKIMDAQAIGSTEHVQKQQEKNAEEEQRQRDELLYKMKIENMMAKLKQPKHSTIREVEESLWGSDDDEPESK